MERDSNYDSTRSRTIDSFNNADLSLFSNFLAMRSPGELRLINK